MCVKYFSMRNYMIVQNSSMHSSWWTYGQMHNLKPIYPVNFFKVGCINPPLSNDQVSSPYSNRFRDLLRSLNCPTFQQVLIRGFFFSFNQVMYPPSLISWLSFKPLAQILFKISCSLVYNAKIVKGPWLWKNKVTFNLVRLFTHHSLSAD